MSLKHAFILGALTGSRSMSPLAILANSDPAVPETPPLKLMQSPLIKPLLAVMATGELIADKTPFVPSRTDLPPLTGRILIGGLCGCIVTPENRIAGIIAGSFGALLSTYVGYTVRKWLTTNAGLPDFIVALAEDSIVLGGAYSTVQDLAEIE